MKTRVLRSLLSTARRACDEQTLSNIVEPMLADLEYELASAGNRFRRAMTMVRWSLGFCEAALLCGGRVLIARSSQFSLERVTVWFYGLMIMAAIGAGPSWVRTGRVSLLATLQGLSRVVPFLPWAFGWGIVLPTGTVRLTSARVILLASLVVIACELNPGNGMSIAGMAAGNFALMLIMRRRFPRSQYSDHLTIKA